MAAGNTRRNPPLRSLLTAVQQRPTPYPVAAARQGRVDLLEQTPPQSATLQKVPEVQDRRLDGNQSPTSTYHIVDGFLSC